MKKVFLINLLFMSVICQAGELHWQTNKGIESRLNCQIEAQSHSSSISEFWLDCEGNPIIIDNQSIQDPKGHRSYVYVNDQILSCPLATSIFGNDAVSFYILIDCRTTVQYKK